MRYIAAAVFVLIVGLIALLMMRPPFSANDAALRIVFQVASHDGAAVGKEDLAETARVIRERLAAGGFDRIAVDVTGADEIIVAAPELTEGELEAVRSLATRPGTLEFALIANQRDHAALIAKVDPLVYKAPEGAAWVPLSTGADGQPMPLVGEQNLLTRQSERDGVTVKEVLIVQKPPRQRLTDELLMDARVATGPGGAPTFEFTLSNQGGYLMQVLTGGATPAPDGFKRLLAIILEGEVHSAPTINDAIGGRGIIEGDFTRDELELLTAALRAGRLPTAVDFVEAHAVQD